MIWLVQDAHQRGFRSEYTECQLIKKLSLHHWLYHMTTCVILLIRINEKEGKINYKGNT